MKATLVQIRVWSKIENGKRVGGSLEFSIQYPPPTSQEAPVCAGADGQERPAKKAHQYSQSQN